MRRCLVLGSLIVLLWATRSAAQVSTMPRPLADPYPIGRAYDDLNLLDADYNGGNWELAEWRAKQLLKRARMTTTIEQVQRALDFAQSYVIVAWIGRDAFDKPTLA